jgi:6,7-dimethyl-8-ribityllumazine synthase
VACLGSSLKIAIIHARWNSEVIRALVTGAVEKLQELGVKEENITITSVPGSYELPFGTRTIHQHNPTKFDAYIAIGTLLKGETMHFEYISEAVSHGLMRLQEQINKPVIFGLLVSTRIYTPVIWI